MQEVDILKSLGCPENVILHCKAVSKLATDIAGAVKIPVDKDLIKRGALLHDIGRCRTHALDHGVAGAKILREKGIGEEFARIAQRHIGAGITRKEAEELGLPPGDYCPETPEEKIIAYADNLVMGQRAVTFEESLKRFKRELGENHPAVKRTIELHEEIQGWIRG